MTEPIDQATKDLIEKEANELLLKYPADRALSEGRKKWYIAGATVWAEKLKQERELRKELYEGLSEIYASTDFSTTISEMIEYLLKKAKDQSHE